MGDSYDAAAAGSDANARAALAALAQAGTAGKAAYDQGQASLQTAQQAAVSQALGKAQLIGGAEAFSPSFTNTVNQPYIAGSRALGEYSAQNNMGLEASNAINRNYMAQVKHAIPISRGLTTRAIAEKQAADRQTNLTGTDAKNQYIGAGQSEAQRIREENTAKYWEAKNAHKAATTGKNPHAQTVKKLDKDIDFALTTLREMPKTHPGRAAADAKLKSMITQRNDAQKQQAALQASIPELEKNLATARATSLAQPDPLLLARQYAESAGVDKNVARGMFGDEQIAERNDQEAGRASRQLDRNIKAFDLERPDIAKFAKDHGLSREVANKEAPLFAESIKNLDTYLTDPAYVDDPFAAEAAIRKVWDPVSISASDDLVKRYRAKYKQYTKIQEDAE